VFHHGNGEHKRERLCGRCHAEAKENRGMTVAEIKRENERWEMVFSQKFADPNYYNVRPLALQSSFGAFASQMEGLCRG
jgi:hypothetical protein